MLDFTILYTHLLYLLNCLLGLVCLSMYHNGKKCAASDFLFHLFQLAEAKGIPHKFNKEVQMAGRDWFRSFIKRHPELAVRLPESTSISRAKAFNKDAISKFFDNLEPFIGVDQARIYNVDETGISTVTKPVKILAARGRKRVGSLASGERGTNTTVICCMSATGIFVPPMFIYKRQRMAPHLMNGAPAGSIGDCSESGWVNEDLFFKWLQHFQKFTSSSVENPVLLIADNHSSHISISIWEFVREHGIYFVTIPPHTSHRVQPLDVSFFKPLKTNYAENVRLWLLQNHGKGVTPADVAGIFNKAYSTTCRMELAVSGFRATGISPFNRNVFTEEDFIFNESEPEPMEENSLIENAEEVEKMSIDQQMKDPTCSNTLKTTAVVPNKTNQVPSSSAASTHNNEASSSSCVRVLIKKISPKPTLNVAKTKANSRTQTSQVMHGTPIKARLQEKAQKKAAKSDPKQAAAPQKAKKGMQKKPNETESESDDEFNICLVCCEHFENSKSKEQWVECYECKHWAHQACTPGFPFYVCHNCESD